MYRYLFLLLFLVSTAPALRAQTNNYYNSAADSDPQAKALLEDVRAKYDGYQTVSADFRLEMAFPGQDPEVQRGTINRRGDQVRFKLGNQEGIINDEAAYIIMHASKEVQINNLPEPGENTGMLTPQSLFNFYEGDQYVMAVQREEVQNGRRVQIIEMKPLDREMSDFSKLRLAVDDRAREIVSVKAFGRDGSNYTFYLDDTQGDAPLAAGTFEFDKADFPGYHVEDLRF